MQRKMQLCTVYTVHIMNGIKCVPACSPCKGILNENARTVMVWEDTEDEDSENQA